jgi:hypothetical protein
MHSDFNMEENKVDIIVINQAGVRKTFYEFPNDVAAALIHLGLAVPSTKRALAHRKMIETTNVQNPVDSNNT